MVPGRESHLRFAFPQDNPFGRMLCTDRYKYVIHERGEHHEQLFDMQNDPLENQSLAGDEAMQSVLTEHRERLRAWCSERNDD
jgi:arylsulfatase A-like enzyme